MAAPSAVILISCSLLLSLFACANAQAASPPAPPLSLSPTPSPAPAPAPHFVDLTHLLSVAGPFSTFLNYLQSTKVIDTFQNQANNTKQGVTIFVPTNAAFKALKKPSLSNLTADQLKSVMLFHGLPQYYSLSEFKNLSQKGAVSTSAGGQYTLNFVDVSGTVRIDSGWSITKVSSSVYSPEPVAVYQIQKVLLPEAIFGTDIPPTPAPAPAPDISPVANSPADSEKGSSSPAKSASVNSSNRVMNSGVWSQLGLALSGLLILFL